MTSREEQARHLECLDAEIAETCARLREIRHDRDITAAWIEGYDARDAETSDGAKIIAGLHDALAFTQGDETSAKITVVVPKHKRHDKYRRADDRMEEAAQ